MSTVICDTAFQANPKTKLESIFDEHSGRLMEHVSVVEGRFRELVSRLAPVLCPDERPDEAQAETQPAPCSEGPSQLRICVNSACGRLGALAEEIGEVKDRLDV